MSVRHKHESSQRNVGRIAGHSTVFAGVRSEEQKPKACDRCGVVIAFAYRVYDRDKATQRVTRGQYEVAHLDDEGGVLSWDCFGEGPLDKYLNARAAREEANPRVGANRNSASGVVHLWQEMEGGRVMCGAAGTLRTTEDKVLVTCNNCERRLALGEIAVSRQEARDEYVDGSTNNQNDEDEDSNDNEQEETTAMNTTTTTTVVPAEQSVKEKIAAAKAKAAAKQTAGGAVTVPAGAAAALTADAATMPKAVTTKNVAKPAVARKEKVAKEPKAVRVAKAKVWNLCGCGCGSSTLSRYLPGHDAKLHGWMKRVGDGRMKVEELPEQVRNGMYRGVKQQIVKTGDVSTLQGAAAKVNEGDYLVTLVGQGVEVVG